MTTGSRVIMVLAGLALIALAGVAAVTDLLEWNIHAAFWAFVGGASLCLGLND